MKYLNLGCGSRFVCSDEWINMDIYSNNKCVIQHNIIQGLPFEDNVFDVVYHSNVLEHLQKQDADNFLKECYRVLKTNGVLRIALPDLEETVRQYLLQLDLARKGDAEAMANYEWITIELLDQITRVYSGGLMGEYLSRENILNTDYVIRRIGNEGRQLMETFQKRRSSVNDNLDNQLKKSFKQSFRVMGSHLKQKALKLLLKDGYDYWKLAKFRSQGEVHQWMYDSYSLAKLLKEKGFTRIEHVAATESSIPGWNNFELDAKDNAVMKPDSFFTEAFK